MSQQQNVTRQSNSKIDKKIKKERKIESTYIHIYINSAKKLATEYIQILNIDYIDMGAGMSLYRLIVRCRVQGEVYMEQCWLYNLIAAGRKDLLITHIRPTVDYYGLLWQWIIALSGLL